VRRPSFAETYAAEAPFVWRSLRRLGVHERDVEDACQEAFLVAHRKYGTFVGGSIRAWLFAIVRRVAADHRKRAHVRREVLDPTLLEGGAAETTTEAIDVQRARTMLDEILATLDEDKREVFIFFELEGCSMAEVAQVLECPLPTAYSRLYAARETIERAIARVQSRAASSP